MAQIHPNAVIDKKAELGKDVEVGPNCVIEHGTKIGDGCVLDANVVIGSNVSIGKCNRFFANCVIGRAPQLLGLEPDKELGGLVIGDNNIFREQVTVHPSIYADKATEIGNDNLLMIGVHVGHDCLLSDKLVISNYTQLSGHCAVQTGVWLSGLVSVHQFVTIGRWSYAAGLSGINHDVPPFVIINDHYPLRVRSINERGLQRAGFSKSQQQAIFKAFKKLYRNEEPLLENAKSMAAEEGLDENVREMADAIIKSSQHRFGRYLEQFRH